MSDSLADRPEPGGKMYHLSISKGELPNYVLLPGDPGRVDGICKCLEDPEIVSSHREYRIARGRIGDVEIGVCSTGIGGPSTAIALEELARVGCDTFIRVGSTASLRKGIGCGELIINTASLGLGGTTKEYVAPEYPANADYEVTQALIQSCEENGIAYHVGIAASTDSFYLGQARPGLNDFFPSSKEHFISDLRKCNIMNFEMEAATLFTLCNIYGLRSGSVCVVYANRETNAFSPIGQEDAITSAIGALSILHVWDKAKNLHSKKHFYPDLLKK
ncbi:MAG: nucleoside phosphorylase [Candidatus Methanofastidiosa archaeon]|nr:nucleoside phosphorylase [Candidatus Methanofastidiosa archaeon]